MTENEYNDVRETFSSAMVAEWRLRDLTVIDDNDDNNND